MNWHLVITLIMLACMMIVPIVYAFKEDSKEAKFLADMEKLRSETNTTKTSR